MLGAIVFLMMFPLAFVLACVVPVFGFRTSFREGLSAIIHKDSDDD